MYLENVKTQQTLGPRRLDWREDGKTPDEQSSLPKRRCKKHVKVLSHLDEINVSLQHHHMEGIKSNLFASQKKINDQPRQDGAPALDGKGPRLKRPTQARSSLMAKG